MEVALWGTLSMDTVARANVPFSSGDSLPGEICTEPGGTGWNIARNLALLGAGCSFISLLAEDGQAPRIRAEARQLGIDLSGCRWEGEENCRTVTVYDRKGEVLGAVSDMKPARRMDGAFAARTAAAAGPCCAAVAEAGLSAAALQALAGQLPATVPLVADGVSASRCMRLEAILPRIHSLSLRLPEAVKLSGYAGPERCATALLKKGVTRVLIHLGSEGLLLAEGDEMHSIPALTGHPVSLRGTGEAVTAALAVALVRNLDSLTCAKLAAAAAAAAAQSPEAVNPAMARLRVFTGEKRA